MTTFNPDKWATSLAESLRDYILGEMGDLVTDTPQVYEVIMEYPPADALAKKMPFKSTIIHFEIDDPRQMFFGFGDNVVNQAFDEIAGTVEEWEAHCHEVDINVGVWASVESGGSSARLEARQDLDRLFNGPSARERCMAVTDGVEILSFSGGQHVVDRINDLPVFRIIDAELRVRVYSRTKKTPIEFIDGVEQEPGLTIDETLEITI
jgi:hypothetical protein